MSTSAISLKRYHLSQLVAARFYAKRVSKGALLWGGIFSLTVVSSAIGFTAAYTTLASRQQLASSFDSNVGLKVLLGAPHHIETVAGFTDWRSLGIVILIGSIWALLTATKYSRGEEMAGRSEVFLAGKTTARRMAANTLLALGAGLLVMFALVAIITLSVGHSSKVDFSAHSSLLFALAMISSSALFLSVGAFFSQIMPIRGRAATATAAVFGLSFGLRAIANATSSAHWLINISPLGWVENTQPLQNAQTIWFLPIGLFIAVFVVLTLWLAGKRDLGDSFIADKDSATPHVDLLNTPLMAAFRLTRTSIFGWLGAISGVAFAFGFVAKSAGQAFSSSKGAGKVISHIAHQSQITGSVTFLGIIFMIIMLLMMAVTASAVSNLREDEAEGYLDNLLVRAVSRTQWLAGRILLITLTIGGAGLLAGTFSWVSAASQHSGVSFHLMVLSGVNAMAPAALTLGIAILIFGFVPRLASSAGYAVMAWSFLMEIIGSVIKLNHWFLDTSLLHDIALAPATNPDWQVVINFVAIGIVCVLLGILRFSQRDLMNE